MASRLKTIYAKIKSPPPWLWLGEGCLWQRLGNAPLWQLPLEVLQQLHWWLIPPRYWPSRRRPDWLSTLPWQLKLLACRLNSYRPAEVAWWGALGVRTWNELAKQTPDSLASAVHAQRRRHWPKQCRPALQLLADKAALLAGTPEQWRAPFTVLQPLQSAHQPSRSGEGLTPQERPAWWWEALAGEGVVLKPQRGHAGRGVIRFRWRGAALEQQALFRRLPADAPHSETTEAPSPEQLLAHWQQLCRCQEPALLAPYIRHSEELPAAVPSVVVRVVTSRPTPEGPVAVQQAWLEVPLCEGAVAFISPDGESLPTMGEPWTEPQQNSLDQWKQLLSKGVPSCVQACLQAAVGMHERLPPMDQVAWDWIPASPQPLLLEGNGGFGLLVPQLYAYRQSRATKRVLP